jgi:quercetin dioxygenase-like cupin family protein
MRFFRFDADVAHQVTQYDSAFRHQFLGIADGGQVSVSVMHFGAGDHVGRHEARVAQIFAVVSGAGWVQAEGERVPISSGRAAFWEAGEAHAAGTDGEMTVVVVEGADLHPERVMPEASG